VGAFVLTVSVLLLGGFMESQSNVVSITADGQVSITDGRQVTTPRDQQVAVIFVFCIVVGYLCFLNCLTLYLVISREGSVNTSTILLGMGVVIGSVEPWVERKVWVKLGLVRSKSAATLLASFLILLSVVIYAFITYFAYRNAKARWVLAPMFTSCEDQCGWLGCDSDSIDQITASNVERLVQSFNTSSSDWTCSNLTAAENPGLAGATESLTCFYSEGKGSCGPRTGVSAFVTGVMAICCCGLGGCELPQPN
jgi:hypothetical protein